MVHSNFKEHARSVFASRGAGAKRLPALSIL